MTARRNVGQLLDTLVAEKSDRNKLTADHVLTVKKVELGNFEERGVYVGVERGNGTETRGDCTVSKVGRHQ